MQSKRPEKEDKRKSNIKNLANYKNIPPHKFGDILHIEHGQFFANKYNWVIITHIRENPNTRRYHLMRYIPSHNRYLYVTHLEDALSTNKSKFLKEYRVPRVFRENYRPYARDFIVTLGELPDDRTITKLIRGGLKKIEPQNTRTRYFIRFKLPRVSDLGLFDKDNNFAMFSPFKSVQFMTPASAHLHIRWMSQNGYDCTNLHVYSNYTQKQFYLMPEDSYLNTMEKHLCGEAGYKGDFKFPKSKHGILEAVIIDSSHDESFMRTAVKCPIGETGVNVLFSQVKNLLKREVIKPHHISHIPENDDEYVKLYIIPPNTDYASRYGNYRSPNIRTKVKETPLCIYDPRMAELTPLEPLNHELTTYDSDMERGISQFKLEVKEARLQMLKENFPDEFLEETFKDLL